MEKEWPGEFRNKLREVQFTQIKVSLTSNVWIPRWPSKEIKAYGRIIQTLQNSVPERLLLPLCFSSTLISPKNSIKYLLFFFFSSLLSFTRSFLAISMTSLASFSGARSAMENEPGLPYSEERVEARDKLFLRFSLTASLSKSLALRKWLSHSHSAGIVIRGEKHFVLQIIRTGKHSMRNDY